MRRPRYKKFPRRRTPRGGWAAERRAQYAYYLARLCDPFGKDGRAHTYGTHDRFANVAACRQIRAFLLENITPSGLA